MTSRKAITTHHAIVECKTHKRRRTFKVSSPKPKNKCPVCWTCWLADKLETILYQDDLTDIFTLSNAFLTTVKTSGIVFEETMKDE